MALANLDLEKLKAKIRGAQLSNDPILARFRKFARRLKQDIKALRRYSVNAVSFVSADGGDNRLTFNPSVIELVRVVDSRGNECALDAVPNTAAFSELEKRIQVGSPYVVQPLQRLCADLAVDLWDLSYLLRAAGTPGKSTGAVRCYRDIVEWSVLYDLVTNPAMQWGSDTILVRDGLLRTKSFTRSVFPKIDGKIREGIGRHEGQNVRLSLVGVAKQSAVLGTLALALELEAVFDRDYPCYVRVPTEIEEECYNYDRTWLDTYETAEPDDEGRRLYQSFGNLFLVKFGDRKLDPVWPVDIAEWQVQEADRILGQLTVDAQYGFPIPDYPMCIQQAHDYAKITGLEVEVLQDLLIEAMEVGLTPDQTERLLRLKHLGRSLAALRYKEA
jgi:hypothetical protein